MHDYILRQDIFPLTCTAPDCQKQYDLDTFDDYLQQRGLVINDYGKGVHLGITCTLCNTTSVWKYPKNNPPLDLRHFVLQPTLEMHQDLIDKLYEIKKEKMGDSPLNFATVHKWDSEFGEKQIREELKFYEHPNKSSKSCSRPDKDISANLVAENNDNIIRLRRLYLKNSPLKYIIELLDDPNAYSETIGQGRYPDYSESRGEKNKRVNEAILFFINRATGLDFKKKLISEIKRIGSSHFPLGKVDELVEETLKKYTLDVDATSDKYYRSLIAKKGWEDNICEWDIWKNKAGFDALTRKALFSLSATKKRKELSQWSKKIKEGSALFVDAPMGLGKSSSIFELLSKNQEKSAVAFFPTKDLCLDNALPLYRTLCREQIGWEDIPYKIEYQGKEYTDAIEKIRKHGSPNVYMVDGINPEECDFFDKIIKRYKNNWFNKNDYCGRCKKKSFCRFINWSDEAPKSRIIITTHAQYDTFLANKKLHKWEKNDSPPVKRDMFIVDEDLVLLECFSPIKISYSRLRESITLLSQIIEEQESSPRKAKNIQNKLDALLGKISRVDKSCVICPIDTSFSLPGKVIQFAKKYSEQLSYIPEYSEIEIPRGNLPEVIAHGIKYGVAVQKYSIPSIDPEKGDTIIFNPYFPNPKEYYLADAPPHVFFDGTLIEKKLLRLKIKGVKLDTVKIEFPRITKCEVLQNTNTSLPNKRVKEDEEKIVKLVEVILDNVTQRDPSGSIFIHTTKTIYDSCIEKIVNEYNKNTLLNLEANYYGNLRGHNKVEGFKNHIMLGEHNPPDAVEIAMGLEFIQKELSKYDILANRNEMWTWKGSNSIRCYIEPFDILNTISKVIRHSEQRQALARTRPINNDVTYYVIAKEPVDEYELFLSNRKIFTQSLDLFPPRKQRGDNKYEEILAAILKLSYKKKYQKKGFCDMDIKRMTNCHRNTVKEHREQLMKEGIIRTVEGRKKKYQLVC